MNRHAAPRMISTDTAVVKQSAAGASYNSQSKSVHYYCAYDTQLSATAVAAYTYTISTHTERDEFTGWAAFPGEGGCPVREQLCHLIELFVRQFALINCDGAFQMLFFFVVFFRG